MSIKIAFYGETENTGTTSNMLLLAWMMALKKPEQAVFVEKKAKRYVLWKGISRKDPFLFMDCGNGRTKEAKYRLMRADLVVVNLPSEPEYMEPYFLYKPHGKERIFFLVGNYHGKKDELKRCMKNIYRVEEQDVGWIPYNNEYAYFWKKGKISGFIREYQKKNVAEHNRCFFEEMEHSFFLLQKKIEAQSNELENRR